MGQPEVLQSIRQLLRDHGAEFREVHHPPTRTSQEAADARGESIVIGAVAMLFGSFSTPLIASLLALGVMIIGRFSAEIIQLQERSVKLGESSLALDFARGLLELLPPLHLYNVTEEVVYGVHLPSSYWVSATLTGLTYSAICLALSQVIFQRRDLT